MGQIEQRRLQRLLGQMGGVEGRGRWGERHQRPVGLLQRPAQRPPQAHEEVNAQQGDGVHGAAVGVAQRRLVEVAAIGLVEHQNVAQGDVLQRRLQFAGRQLELLQEGRQPRLVGLHLLHRLPVGLSEKVEARFLRRREGVVGPVEQVFVGLVEGLVGRVAAGLGVLNANAQLVEDGHPRQLRVDEAGADDLDHFFVADPQATGQRLGRAERKGGVGQQPVAAGRRVGPHAVEGDQATAGAAGGRAADGGDCQRLRARRVGGHVEGGAAQPGPQQGGVGLGQAQRRLPGVGRGGDDRAGREAI